MTAFLLFLAAIAATPPESPSHWLGEMQVRAEADESVTTEEGPDFRVFNVVRDGKTLFSAYHGNYPSLDSYRVQRFRRACDVQFFRVWSRGKGPKRIVGYLARRESFSTHVFGDAITGSRRALRGFERRIVFADC